ncbi:hypothetical protein AAHE18_03G220600 [Arachis hypogaea]|nr:uncharacterized protein DS421_3g88550 [Arachis hypogaea]
MKSMTTNARIFRCYFLMDPGPFFIFHELQTTNLAKSFICLLLDLLKSTIDRETSLSFHLYLTPTKTNTSLFIIITPYYSSSFPFAFEITRIIKQKPYVQKL